MPRPNEPEARLAKYGLNKPIYAAMLALQTNLCDVCKLGFSETPHIDHDHAHCRAGGSCGLCVRGLLCGPCNYIVGALEHGGVNESMIYWYANEVGGTSFGQHPRNKWEPGYNTARMQWMNSVHAAVPEAAARAYLDRWSDVRQGRFETVRTFGYIAKYRQSMWIERLVPLA